MSSILVATIALTFSGLGILVLCNANYRSARLVLEDLSEKTENIAFCPRKTVRVSAKVSGEAIESLLPIMMEQLVISVQAGLDIYPALCSIVETDKFGKSDSNKALNPVVEIFSQVVSLTECGMGLEESLRRVGDSSPSIALRHAFLHLALAYREGGELVMPLRELSDATQLYYQETLEEQIAKLPVKATLPLIFTFTGLLILFLTVPLIQVMNISASAAQSSSRDLQ